MTTEQTAQQFELAAKILRTGHPWEWQASDGEWVKPTIRTELHHVISDGLAIRLALAAPPDGRQLHNPDNLTAEQVGVGYRLMLPEEVDGRHEGKCQVWNSFGAWSSSEAEGTHKTYSYRLPLSVPWPEPADPYADLKKAHAEGRVIQARPQGYWVDSPNPSWNYPVEDYRIKPEPTFQLPPPPPGMQWHRTDGWQEDDLPQGCRPMCAGETYLQGDEWRMFDGWQSCKEDQTIKVWPRAAHSRTRRPLTFTHAGKTWTWHRPGDPHPCDGNAKICVLTRDGDYNSDGDACCARIYAFGDLTEAGLKGAEIIGWRYADEKKTVPLGPEDVHPCSVFRIKGKGSSGWHQMKMCPQWDGLVFTSKISVTYEELMRDWLINRSIPLTGKWNPDAWEHCHKEVDA